MRISVLVPSYKRPDLLIKCLGALEKQRRMPDEIVIVMRDTDLPSQAAFSSYRRQTRLPLVQALVSRPGQMAAMNTGLDLVTGEIVCFTDDDAEPFPDWVERIESRFQADPGLGALGGRDHVHVDGVLQPTMMVTTVGKLHWYGRTRGNHSQDSIGFRETDCLKGVNLSVRTALQQRFDERFRGDAAQNEVAFCLAIRNKGMKIMYDPEIRVNHFLGARQYGSGRTGLTPERLFNNSFNHVLARVPYLPGWKKSIYLAYTVLVGETDTPGLLKAVLLSRGHPSRTFDILSPSLRGKFEAIRTSRTGSRPGPRA